MAEGTPSILEKITMGIVVHIKMMLCKFICSFQAELSVSVFFFLEQLDF